MTSDEIPPLPGLADWLLPLVLIAALVLAWAILVAFDDVDDDEHPDT